MISTLRVHACVRMHEYKHLRAAYTYECVCVCVFSTNVYHVTRCYSLVIHQLLGYRDHIQIQYRNYRNYDVDINKRDYFDIR